MVSRRPRLLALGLILVLPLAMAAPARSKSLAQFDSGYAQCEKRHAEMRGHGDEVYARVYRLKFDDELRSQLAETRKSALYRSERRRAAQNLTKNAAASDVAQRLDLQCQALQRELQSAAPASAPKR
jgi:hypothetical protein